MEVTQTAEGLFSFLKRDPAITISSHDGSIFKFYSENGGHIDDGFVDIAYGFANGVFVAKARETTAITPDFQKKPYSKLAVSLYNQGIDDLYTRLTETEKAIRRNTSRYFSCKNTLLGKLALPFFGGRKGIAEEFKRLKEKERHLNRRINRYITNRDKYIDSYIQ